MNYKHLLPLPVLCSQTIAHAATASTSTASPTLGLLQVVLSLLVILALIIGAAWMAKRYLTINTHAGTAIKMIGGINVGGRERVLLLEIGEQWVVIGVAPGHVSTLTTMPRQTVTPPPNTEQPKAFSAWLKQMMDKGHA